MLRPEKREPDPLLSTLSLTVDLEEKSGFKSSTKWIVISLFTLLWHLGVLSVKSPMGPQSAPPPVEVQQIDPAKLEAIKEQWKQRAMLLSKDKTPIDPNVKANDQARYDSDRNRVVQKEQRAQNTNVVPERMKSKPQSATAPQKQSLPKISDLGALGDLIVPRKSQMVAQQNTSAGEDARNSEQALMDDSLPTGAENLLNTRESVYYSFFSRIQEAIGPLWQSKIHSLAGQIRVPTGDYIALVEVVLDPEGNFAGSRIIRSSGVRHFDNAVEASWKKVPRFPNPPRDLFTEDGLLHIQWNYVVRIDQNSGFQYVPPERYQEP